MPTHDLNEDVKDAMDIVVQLLKRHHPELQFFFLMIPFHISQVHHLSTEEMNTLEKRVVRAANLEFEKQLKRPEGRRRET